MSIRKAHLLRLLRRSIALAQLSRLNAFEHQLEAGPIHFSLCHFLPIREESTLLQALGPKTESGAVPVEYFHLSGPPIDEDEKVAGQRIPVQGVAGQRIEPIIRLTHIHRLTAEMHPHMAFREEHQPRTRCRTMPPPNSRRSSTRGEAASSRGTGVAKSSSAPRSKKSGVRWGVARAGTLSATVSDVPGPTSPRPSNTPCQR